MKPLMLLGGLHVDKRKVDDFLNPLRSPSTFMRVVGVFARYGLDRLRYSRGTDIGAGNALVAMLVYSLQKRHSEMWTDAPLVRLLGSRDQIDGAVIRRNGHDIAVRARRGVILATGGFSGNPRMRHELALGFPHEFSVGFEGNTGDGITAAQSFGSDVDTRLASPGYWTPCSSIVESGVRRPVLYGYLDRGRPGVIAVDQSGKRFVNESNSYHDVGIALQHAGYAKGNFFHFVCDRTFVWHHGLGMIRPFRFSLRRYIKADYIVVADSISELASKMGVPAAALSETVRRHNEYAKTGHDPEFGKGSTAYNRLFGHSRAAPNRNLAPIVKPPFVALRILPATLGTAVGLQANKDAQVLNRDGKPIAGLYACGNDMASVMRGRYPAGGITLGPAIAFAYRAAAHATFDQSQKASAAPRLPDAMQRAEKDMKRGGGENA